MKVIVETCRVYIPDEGYCRNMSCTYLMKVIVETCVPDEGVETCHVHT